MKTPKPWCCFLNDVCACVYVRVCSWNALHRTRILTTKRRSSRPSSEPKSTSSGWANTRTSCCSGSEEKPLPGANRLLPQWQSRPVPHSFYQGCWKCCIFFSTDKSKVFRTSFKRLSNFSYVPWWFLFFFWCICDICTWCLQSTLFIFLLCFEVNSFIFSTIKWLYFLQWK